MDNRHANAVILEIQHPRMRLAQVCFFQADRRIALGLDRCRIKSVRWRCCGLLRVTQGDGVRAFFGE